MLEQNSYQTMKIDRRDKGIVVVRFNRPDRLNAVNGTMHAELARLSRDFANDRDLKVMILTGEGRAFCAGGDFGPGDPIGSNPEGPTMMVEARQIVDHILECDKPIVSAVNGYAMGLGATVALLCDIVIACPSTVIADTHVNMGIGAGDGGQLIWPFLMGVNRAKYYLMTGDRISGKEVLETGLASFYVEDDKQLLPKALEIADKLASGAPQAIAASKMAINAYLRSVSSVIMPISLKYEELTMKSEDHKEAVRAFQEKRIPVFTGR
ncbi:MAG: enoyl-CoA hydratase-related protein [Gammaproteobacteria bacterium]|nr:enoyl-CoA hydratase-related protein [Gammaproteobacteria bacterium]